MSKPSFAAAGAEFARYLHARRTPRPGPWRGAGALASYPVDLRPFAPTIDRFPLSLRFQRAPGGLPVRKEAVEVAEAGIGYFQRPDSRSDALLMAEWLVINSVPGPGDRGVAWHTSAAEPRYGLHVLGWPSARAQGQAISALLRAHSLSGEERYLATARGAVEPMTVDVADGGVRRRLDGSLVFETYPVEAPVAGLAGWLYALVGLRELHAVTGDERAAALADESRGGLVELLPRYELAWWSRASLYEPSGRPDLARIAEHRLAALLLDELGRATADERIQATARRWRALDTPVAAARLAWAELAQTGRLKPR